MLLSALLLSGAETLAAQAGTTLPSPTLPSDTLEANYAPRSGPGPMPELAPTLPSDTLQATAPVDSVPTDSASDDNEQAPPQSPGDSAALRDIRSWIQRHPGLILPPPVRAVLVQV
jgi:hypothetical protein